MAVDTTIPSSSNNVGDDLSAIRENFELLASAQVVDEGSTSDGDYIRYENGWQICFQFGAIVDLGESGSTAADFPYPNSFVNSVSTSFNTTDHEITGDGSTNLRALAFVYDFSDIGEWDIRMGQDHKDSDLLGGNDPDDLGEIEVSLMAIGKWK